MTTETLDRLSHKIILASFFLLFFATPLTWTSFTHELFEYPKMMLTYGITIIIAASWITRMIAQNKPLIQKTPFDIPLILFLLSQILSTIFSIDFRTSVFGYYTRFHGGLLSTMTYLTLYYAFVSNINKTQAKTYLKTILASGFIASLYALPEHFGISPSCLAITGQATVECWVQDVQNRIFGTFGQPNWLAAYLITIFAIPTAFIINNQKTLSLKNFSYYLLPITYYLTLVFTRSRSGLAALAVTYALFWLLTYLKQKGSLINKFSLFPWKIFLIISSLLVITSIITGTQFSPSAQKLLKKFKTTNQTQSQPQPEPVPKPQIGTQLETGGTESGAIRKIVWKGALDVWQNWFLFGSGVETFAYSYYNFRPQEHNLVSEWDFLYNKAHNEFLNFLATTGLVGLTTYLLFIGWYTSWSIKSKDPLVTALIAGFWGLAVSNFFGFATVPVAILFFLYPAFALALTKTTTSYPLLAINYSLSKSYLKKKKRRKLKPKSLPSLTTTQWLTLTALLIPSTYLLFILSKSFRADAIFAKGKNLSDAGYLEQAIPQIQNALKLSPKEPLYHNQFAESLAKYTITLAQNQEASQAAQFAQLAISASDTAIKANKVHVNFYKTRAKVLLTLTQLDPNLLTPAQATLQKAIKLSPTDAKLIYNLGLTYLNIGDQQQALSLLSQAVNLKPNYEAARQQLALLLEELDQPNEAKTHWQYILEHINPKNKTALEKLQN